MSYVLLRALVEGHLMSDLSTRVRVIRPTFLQNFEGQGGSTAGASEGHDGPLQHQAPARLNAQPACWLPLGNGHASPAGLRLNVRADTQPILIAKS